MAHENVIEMHEITKIFGEFVANDKINLNLRRDQLGKYFFLCLFPNGTSIK